MNQRETDRVAVVFDLYSRWGAELYAGEPVTQLEHALQTAQMAVEAKASDSLIVAALLHDVGHLLCQDAESAAASGHDAEHERIGMVWLRRHFREDVAAPVFLHVSAKRYLCAIDPQYMPILSSASLRSLALQGGPMSAGEVEKFERAPHWADAARLRRWDDRAKVPGLSVAPLGYYHAYLERTLLPLGNLS